MRGGTARGREAARELVDGRVQLRIAHEQFTSIGMEVFADQTAASCWRQASTCLDVPSRLATI
jgi:hypothetical protein